MWAKECSVELSPASRRRGSKNGELWEGAIRELLDSGRDTVRACLRARVLMADGCLCARCCSDLMLM